MKTEIVKIPSIPSAAGRQPAPRASDAALSRAARILREGGLVVFPTETVYGLGGNATDPGAAAKIYAAKGRPSDNPLIVHLARPEDAEPYAHTNEHYYRLARAFMPGPLTVILKKKDTIPSQVTGGLDSVAIRCPSHPTARALIAAAGFPIAAPSTNISGRPSPTSVKHVIEDMDGRVDMIIDGGDCPIGLESTIVKLESGHATILRPGAVTYDDLAALCDSVLISDAAAGISADCERPLSPGMKYRHYAPSSPMILLEGSEGEFIDFIVEKRKEESCAVICSAAEAERLGEDNIVLTGDAGDLEEQARRLFSALREADALGCEVIYARVPPKEGLGLALCNRLYRAAGGRVLNISEQPAAKK